MPIILGLFLRQVVMAVASGAVVTFAQELLDGTFRDLVNELRDTEGVTEQDAKDVVADILLDLALNSASIMVVLKTGAGVKAAEFLGLTSRKFAKGSLSPAAAALKTKIAADGGRGLARRLLVGIKRFVPSPVTALWLFLGLTQVIEPAIYQPAQTERIWQSLGFNFSIPRAEGNLNPGPFSTTSSVTFSEFAQSLESAGIKGIENPAAMASQIYSRSALADLVNYVYGQEVLAGKNPGPKDLIPKLSQYLVGVGTVAAIPSPTVSPAISTNIPKIYTGIVSQGVIGKGLVFTPRPDDLIESVDELRQAAANNLAPFLEALTSKIVYEVKIVPSIITKDGFKQTGTVQQIRNGTTSSGAPRYKTVVNKFATLNLYVLTDKGTRTKISTVVLGPTDSSKLTIGINDLRTIETALPGLVTTSDINEIKGIETANPITITTPASAGGVSTPSTNSAGVVTSAAPASTQGTGVVIPGNNALTLLEWYQSQGQALPSVSTRSKEYERLSLGQQSFYTGTVEQNSKLLVALKREVMTVKLNELKAQLAIKNGTVPSNAKVIKAEDDAPEGNIVERVDGVLYTWPKPKSTTTSGKTVVSRVRTRDGIVTTKYSDGTVTTTKG